ncbi:MAG: type II toxin-antitoxin system RelE/ParE family toxin [Deltaproteobacteria bacterium]|nr:type II toxin-antitoxin system RelE/ParE family toxin [Deltaproteobacteria bacterium]
MPFNVVYHPEAKKDIASLDRKLKDRLKSAVETRLMTAPEQYGAPLRRTLRGFWKLRVGDYRIVFKIAGDEVLILGIVHRAIVYREIERRLQ